jgi:hypothetical protein
LNRFRRVARGVVAAAGVIAVGSASWLAGPEALAGPNHTSTVSDAPSPLTPDITDESVDTIYDAGSKVLAGGSFTVAQNRDSDVDIPRPFLLAFDKATGEVDPGFAPALNGRVTAIIAGPTPGTAFVGGDFTTVNGTNRRKLALIDTATGALVTSFKNVAFNGIVKDLARAGNRLLVGGNFTAIGSLATRNGLASLDVNTGTLDSYLTVSVTEHHNWTSATGGAKAPVGVDKLALSPDGTQLVAIGNFKNANGTLHDQVVKMDLGPDSVTIANWNTDRYTPRCAFRAFDSYVRDVAYSPDGSYFVIVATGAPNTGTLCDAVARWEANATGTTLQPTWIDYSGGDTFLAVAISETSIYVGGHMRWMNNSLGRDSAAAGAVARPSLAALDPVNGLPQAWNPGRHPRGVGVDDLYLTPEGLWVGHDQMWIGNFQYRRERIAFFPLPGGVSVHSTQSATLPGNTYFLGVNSPGGGEPPPPTVIYRVNAGGPIVTATDGGPDWTADKGTDNPLRNSGSSKTANTTVLTSDATVPSTTPQAVFADLRYDPNTDPEMQWNFAATAGKELEVRLYFADNCACTDQPGERVFDVQIDGVTKLDDFDIITATGTNRGTMRSFTITSDGNVDIDFVHGVQNPEISAIEILQKNDAPAPSPTNGVLKRSYDGASTVGAAIPVANPDNTAFSGTRGAFWVGGTLFYGLNNALQRRTFDGVTMGPASLVDPYHSALWDTVETGSGTTGQTYRGVNSNFYSEITNVSGMLYFNGRLYYTLTTSSGLFWRWFTPDSGIVGADKFTVSGATGFSSAGSIFLNGNTLYMTNRTTGQLSTRTWNNGVPGSTVTVVSGPTMGGIDWRARAVFAGPQ